MSVEKVMFTDLVKEKTPFTVLPNDVIQRINYPEALGMWCYLMSLPDKWEVNRAHLMNHFSIGRDKLHSVLKWLIGHKLIEYIWIRDKSGKVEKVALHVKNGKDFINLLSIITSEIKCDDINNGEKTTKKTTILKNQCMVKPVCGKSAPIKEIIKTKAIKREREGKQAPSSAPQSGASLSGFLPSSANKRLCIQHGLTLQDEVESFLNRCPRKHTQYEFKRWLDSGKAYKQKRSGKDGVSARAAVNAQPMYVSPPATKRSPPPEFFQRQLKALKQKLVTQP